jgi:hypothetical protein
MSIPIINVAPNLPLPPKQYDQAYLDNLTKVLRLYFVTNDNFNQVIANQVSSSQALIWLNL